MATLKSCFTFFFLAFSAGCASAQIVLKPAAPQPDHLEPGLNVRYAYPDDVKTLEDAGAALKRSSEPGKPLSGLRYADRGAISPALTSKRVTVVAAKIEGFIRFDEVGDYRLIFHSNDGLDIRIGEQRVGYETERTPCMPIEQHGPDGQTVEVPAAGWYELEAIWFQRFSTSCLVLEWETPSGAREKAPRSAFGHQ